jgi:hypothetical protein
VELIRLALQEDEKPTVRKLEGMTENEGKTKQFSNK